MAYLNEINLYGLLILKNRPVSNHCYSHGNDNQFFFCRFNAAHFGITMAMSMNLRQKANFMFLQKKKANIIYAGIERAGWYILRLIENFNRIKFHHKRMWNSYLNSFRYHIWVLLICIDGIISLWRIFWWLNFIEKNGCMCVWCNFIINRI